MMLVMPLFDRQRFPYWRYQGLGITRTSRKITSGPIAVEPPAQWTGALILKLNWRLVEVPGVGHDAQGMFRSPQAEAALFGR